MDEKIDAEQIAKMVDQLVGEKIKIRRLIMGITQQELGAKIGVSLQQIQKYEKSINRITIGRLFTIARTLKVPVEYFLKTTDDDDQKVPLTAMPVQNFVSEEQLKYNVDSCVTEKEVIALNKIFFNINNTSLRKKIHSIVCMIAKEI